MGVVHIADWRPVPSPNSLGLSVRSPATFRTVDVPVRPRHVHPTLTGRSHLAADTDAGLCRHFDREGGVLRLPLAEQHREAVLDFCRNDAEGDWRVVRQGDAVLFARETDFAFASYFAL